MSDLSLNRMVLSAMAVFWIASIAPLTSAQETPRRASATDPIRVSDKDLGAFVQAYVEYHKIRQIYEAQLAKTQDPKQRERLQREGDSKVKQVLEKQKLTAASYNRLFTAINGNEELRRKTLKLIDEQRRQS